MFRSLSIPFRTFLVTSGGTFVGMFSPQFFHHVAVTIPIVASR